MRKQTIKAPKLKAFTIIEVIVALLLMAIVMGIAYTVLSLVDKQSASLSSNFGTQQDYRLLQEALLQDANRAKTLYLKEGALCCANDTGTISYLFLDSAIVRQAFDLPADTFHFRIDSLYLGFENFPQDRENGLVDEVSLYIWKNRQSFIIHQEKIYDAQTLWPLGLRF